jgi:hypothetical protein
MNGNITSSSIRVESALIGVVKERGKKYGIEQ